MQRPFSSWRAIAVLLAAALGLSCWCTAAAAQPITTAFTYQGELQSEGAPATGLHDLRFRLFDTSAGGVQVGSTICVNNVTVANGRFSSSLDFGAVFSGQQRFLQIDVRADTGLNCGSGSGFVTLTPRQPLTAAPNALFALNADEAAHAATADTATSATTAGTASNSTQLNGQPGSFYQNAANLNSGTLASARLTGAYTGALVLSNAGNAFSGTGAGLTFLNASNLATGTLADARLSGNVALLNTAQTFSAGKTFSAAPSFTAAGSPFSVTATGLVTNLNADRLDGLDSSAFLQSIPVPLTVSGTSATHIIRGENASTSQSSSGVFGLSTNFGVYGQGTGPSGFGVRGWATAGTGFTFGVYGRSDSTGGWGVFGTATAPTGTTYGVYGESFSTQGSGVRGSALAFSGATKGVYGQSSSPAGYGVYGWTNAGIGTTYGVYGQSDSTDGRGVFGTATAASGFTQGGWFESASTDGRGVFGRATAATGTTYGGRFQSSSTSGLGVFGLANASTGSTYGVYGQTYSTAGYGVFGQAIADSGAAIGVVGQSASTSGAGVSGGATATTGVTFGGNFQSDSTSGIGVYALTIAPTGNTYGMYGQSASTSGRGVFGVASATSGSTYGVYGQSASTSGTGVFGDAATATGLTSGVYGRSNSGAGTGVFGEATHGTGFTYGGRFQSSSTSGLGVLGWATAASGTIYGVYGQANTAAAGYAVFAAGDMGASGLKPFRIDHPDDPANKYLLHYAAESPEVINFYSGKATLDAAGEAVVELPHYFAKINKDPRYTLTAIGAPMPMLHVAEEIDDDALSAGAKAEPGEATPVCFFRIAGGEPSAKVSWRVEAVRNDRYVQQRGAPVEVDKQDMEIGTYQHPELYGQPPEKGMNYESARSRPEPVRPDPALRVARP